MREFATVAYIDFVRGQTEVDHFTVEWLVGQDAIATTSNLQGYVRFDEEGGAKKALEGMTADNAKPEICGVEAELRVLEGTVIRRTYWYV